MSISAVICTHNCPPSRLRAVLASVLGQDPPNFEVIVVDNNSSPSVQSSLALHDNRLRICIERNLGLTSARLRGLLEASNDILAFVDDDNILHAGFLAHAASEMARSPKLGIIGGRSRPAFEVECPAWLKAIGWAPGCHDAGEQVQVASWRGKDASQRVYPAFAPIGTGMVVRKAVLRLYADAVNKDTPRRLLDRRGTSLASGGDNDIVLTALANGFDVVYDPRLEITHEIPSTRLETSYVERYHYETNITWVEVLAAHGICPWRPIDRRTLPARRLRAWLRLQPWRNPYAKLDWLAACGQLEGRARIRHVMSVGV